MIAALDPIPAADLRRQQVAMREGARMAAEQWLRAEIWQHIRAVAAWGGGQEVDGTVPAFLYPFVRDVLAAELRVLGYAVQAIPPVTWLCPSRARLLVSWERDQSGANTCSRRGGAG